MTITVTSTGSSETTSVLRPKSTGVQRGLLGIADFACKSGAKYSSPYGDTFEKDCNLAYLQAGLVFGSESETVTDIWSTTTYSLAECMDEWSQFNAHRRAVVNVDPHPPQCQAVTYNVNLTHRFTYLDYTCVLKDARGSGGRFDENDQNYALVASAYIVPADS